MPWPPSHVSPVEGLGETAILFLKGTRWNCTLQHYISVYKSPWAPWKISRAPRFLRELFNIIPMFNIIPIGNQCRFILYLSDSECSLTWSSPECLCAVSLSPYELFLVQYQLVPVKKNMFFHLVHAYIRINVNLVRCIIIICPNTCSVTCLRKGVVLQCYQAPSLCFSLAISDFQKLFQNRYFPP